MLEERALLSGTTEDAPLDNLWYVPPQHNLYQLQGFLTQPKEGDALDIALAYLDEQASNLGLAKEDAAQVVVTDRYTDEDTGVVHIYLSQELNGLRIANATASVHLTKAGEIVALNCALVGGLDRSDKGVEPVLTAGQALAMAGASFALTEGSADTLVVDEPQGVDRSMTLSNADLSERPIPAKLEYVATPTGISLAWNMVLALPTTPDVFSVSVDALTGDVLSKSNWVSYAGYRVYAMPAEGPYVARTWVDGVSAVDTGASPYGWHFSNEIEGNNVLASVDYQGLNEDSRVRPLNVDRNFDYSLVVTEEPFVTPMTYNQQSSATNLFYWGNKLHDVTFRYGFTEAAGNFQSQNYSGQGYGNDRVIADCLDGLRDYSDYTYCSTMEVQPDGTSPTMSLGPVLYPYPHVSRDTALDTMIIVHEYGHGVSKRLVGGASNVDVLNTGQSFYIGEGTSDWFALMFTLGAGDAPGATYNFARWAQDGVSDVYYNHDLQYAWHMYSALQSGSYRARGIWCAALWDMTWEIIARHNNTIGDLSPGYTGPNSAGNVIAMKLVMDALKTMPANPTLLQARDAILVSDSMLTGGQNAHAIWTAFAHRGMGVGANEVPLDNQDTPVYGSRVDTPGLYDAVSSVFYLRNSNSSGGADLTFGFGAPGQGWLPIAGDWDGNGTDTIGLYDRSTSTFYLRNSNTAGPADLAFGFGASNYDWVPIANDWDGNGTDTIGLYVPSNGLFLLRNSNTTGYADWAFGFGATQQTPLAGDWDGSGASGIGVHTAASGTFELRDALSTGYANYTLGLGDVWWKPFAGDWDANGHQSVGVYSPVYSLFYLKNALSTGNADITFGFGAPNAGWLPIFGDWDATWLVPLSVDSEIVGSSAPVLLEEQLRPIIAAAIAEWSTAGLTPQAVEDLRQVEFAIVDLPASYVGLAKRGFVYIDTDAAGHGWRISTPRDTSEGLNPYAVDQVDLYSTVLHELGHVLGLEDLPGEGSELMRGILTPGVQRHVSQDDVLRAASSAGTD